MQRTDLQSNPLWEVFLLKGVKRAETLMFQNQLHITAWEEGFNFLYYFSLFFFLPFPLQPFSQTSFAFTLIFRQAHTQHQINSEICNSSFHSLFQD